MSTNKRSVHKELNDSIGKLATVDTKLTKASASRDAAIKVVSDRHAPKIDALSEEHKALVDHIVEVWSENRDLLMEDGSKTITLRNGDLSIRLSPDSLVIEDPEVVMKYLRRTGNVKEYTRQPKRTPDKVALKKNPELVGKAPGMHISKPENLTIKLNRTQAEITKELNPLRRQV